MADTTHATYPDLGTNSGSTNGTTATNGTNAGFKDSVVNNTQAALDSVVNHPTVHSLTQGPIAQTAKEEVNKTSAQFANVANSRRIPKHHTATGQPLTQYHSLFYNILSWENPRVTVIFYSTIVSMIFFSRYVPILKYTLKATYTVLGIIAAAELAGKLVFDKGLATQVRPRKYYTIPRESLENALGDVEQLANFFVIEFQRIVFAENVYATVAAFSAALIGYFLVKIVPAWGIALISTTVVFFTPLIYVQNQRFIDEQLNNASTVITQQASQVRDLAAQHTGRASESVKSAVSQYSAKAQEIIGQAKDKAPTTSTSAPNTEPVVKRDSIVEPAITKSDFPTAPTTAPTGIADVHPTIGSTSAEPVTRVHTDAAHQPFPAL